MRTLSCPPHPPLMRRGNPSPCRDGSPTDPACDEGGGGRAASPREAEAVPAALPPRFLLPRLPVRCRGIRAWTWADGRQPRRSLGALSSTTPSGAGVPRRVPACRWTQSRVVRPRPLRSRNAMMISAMIATMIHSGAEKLTASILVPFDVEGICDLPGFGWRQPFGPRVRPRSRLSSMPLMAEAEAAGATG